MDNLRSIRAWDLDERINIADCGDVIWNERAELCVQLCRLGCIVCDKLEKLFHLGLDLEALIVLGVISALDTQASKAIAFIVAGAAEAASFGEAGLLGLVAIHGIT